MPKFNLNILKCELLKFMIVSIRHDFWNCNESKVLNFHSRTMNEKRIESVEKSAKWKQFAESYHIDFIKAKTFIHLHVTWISVCLCETSHQHQAHCEIMQNFYRQVLIDHWILISSIW